MNVSLSIIAPKFSADYLKLYEQVNHRSAEIKIETAQKNSYLLLIHNTINLNLEQQQHKQVHSVEAIKVEMKHEDVYIQQQIDAPPNTVAPQQQQQPSQQQQQQQQQPPTVVVHPMQPSPNQVQMMTQQQQQQPQHLQNQPQQQQQVFETSDMYNQAQNITIVPAQHTQIPLQQIQNPQQQQQQQPQQQNSALLNTLRFPANTKPVPIQHVAPINIRQLQQQPQQQIQQGQLNQVQVQGVQIPNITIKSTPQQQQQQQPQQQLTPQQQQQLFVQNQQIPQQVQMPMTAGNPYQQQSKPFWSGIIEWYEKDRTNPNNKVLNQIKASGYSNISISSITGQPEPDIPQAIAQTWPQKLQLQLCGVQLFTMFGAQFDQNSKRITFIPETSSPDMRTVLSAPGLAGGFINFVNTSTDIKILVITVQGNDVIGRVPIDQVKFLGALKQIVTQRNQQQQQRKQMLQQQIGNNPLQQMQQQSDIMINPQQQQQHQIINVNNDQSKDLRHYLSTQTQNNWMVGQQQMQQPPQSQQLMPNNAQQQQQQQQQQSQGNIYITQQPNQQNMPFNMDTF